MTTASTEGIANFVNKLKELRLIAGPITRGASTTIGMFEIAVDISEKRSRLCKKLSRLDKLIPYKRYKDSGDINIDSSFALALSQYDAASL
ncbi:hypothetical protein Plhal304r1_c079g0165551 [Plasmopara halstedii]